MISQATVEVLTAEVHVLMVGSRQITLSVFRQLDTVPYGDLRPFGRVNDGPRYISTTTIELLWLIGGATDTGRLVRSQLSLPPIPDPPYCMMQEPGDRYGCEKNAGDTRHDRTHANYKRAMDRWTFQRDTWEHAHSLPLIVMAGLR